MATDNAGLSGDYDGRMDDVLIVGAGPTGLMMAVWLAESGIKARIVDPKKGPTKETRAVAVQARTLELWDRIGLAERAVQRGHKTLSGRLWVRGKEKARVRFGEIGQGLSPFPYIFMLGQDQTEAMLYERLCELGGDVEWGTRVEQIAENLVTMSTGEKAAFRYVLGCDGASSVVRQEAGLDFPGGTYAAHFYVADVDAAGGVAPGELNLTFFEDRFLAFFPLNAERRFRMIGLLDPALDPEKATVDDVRTEAERLTRTQLTDVRWFSVYRVHHRVVRHFRKGPLFVVGDAAHVHSPVGGQGMNTGLGDAINLAWKLVEVLKHGADERLLDTYEAERLPFAQSLVRTTDRAFELVLRKTPLAQFVKLTLLPLLLPLFIAIPAARRAAFRRVSQIMIEYRMGPLAVGQDGRFVAGERLRPEIAGGGVGWCIVGPASPSAEAWCAHRGIEYRPEGLIGATLLVRPDGYLGCVLPTFDADALDRYMLERVGRPAPMPSA
jgi:2-polyprenyl-6-methoxyphenol hydroxylase-like FAD-dependent oxidoreductase